MSSGGDIEVAVLTAFLVILIPGLVCNLLSLFVWVTSATATSRASPSRQNGTDRLYALLCLSDALAIFHYIVLHAWRLQAHPEPPCHIYLFQCIGDIFCYYSDYLIILIGMQPLTSVLRPFSVTYCNRARQWLAVFVLFVIRLLASAPGGVIYIEYYRYCKRYDLLWFADIEEVNSFVKKMVYVTLGTELLPLFLLLTVNTMLLYFLWSFREANVSGTPSNSRLDQIKRRATQLVVAISVPAILKFIFVQALHIESIINNKNTQALIYCTDFIVILSASVNVLFYSCFGERFRAKMCMLWEKLRNKLACSRRNVQTSSTDVQLYVMPS